MFFIKIFLGEVTIGYLKSACSNFSAFDMFSIPCYRNSIVKKSMQLCMWFSLECAKQMLNILKHLAFNWFWSVEASVSQVYLSKNTYWWKCRWYLKSQIMESDCLLWILVWLLSNTVKMDKLFSSLRSISSFIK